jgi:hypothetical protein
MMEVKREDSRKYLVLTYGCFRFGKRSLSLEAKEMEKVPGPGSYLNNDYIDKVKPKAPGFTLKVRREPKPNLNPGPG